MKKLIPSLLLAAVATVGCATDDALIPPPELEVKEDAELGEVLYLHGLPLLPLSKHQFMSHEIFPSLFIPRNVLPGEINPCPGYDRYLYLNVGPVNPHEQVNYDRANRYAYHFPEYHAALAERFPTGYAVCPSYDPTIQTVQSTYFWRLLEASRKLVVSMHFEIEDMEDGSIVIVPTTPDPAYAEAEVLLRDCTPLFTTLTSTPNYDASYQESWISFLEGRASLYQRFAADPTTPYLPQPPPDTNIQLPYAMDLLLRMDIARCLGPSAWVVNDVIYSYHY